MPLLMSRLYIGDGSDNSLKKFDAATGAFLGSTVKSTAGLHGPRGLVVTPGGGLLVSDQNSKTATRGDILLYSAATGKLLNRVVSNSDPNAPDVPRGLILYGGTIFVADFTTETNPNQTPTPGRLLAYSDTGAFLADLTPNLPLNLRDQFHPRGLVIGPDGRLYVSNIPILPASGSALGGQVLRFDPDTGAFLDVFVNDPGGVGQLNRPEGLVFGPDGNLYITSFVANPMTDTDKIRSYQGPAGLSPGTFRGSVDLDIAGQPRAYAQAIVFGPGGYLFVPINGSGPDTGSVRRYDVVRGGYDVFVPSNAQGGPLAQPWYPTFGQTNPATLAYEGN
jgi:hypothetical protein